MPIGEERVIREVVSRWNAGEWMIDPATIHPEIELHSVLTNSVWRGHVGVQAWIDEVASQFESWTIAIGELTPAGKARWLMLGHIVAKGRAGGFSLDQPAGWGFRFRDGKVALLETFLSHAEARAAAAIEGGS